MAKIHGVAGEWARVKGTVAGLWPLFLGVFVAGAALTVAVLGTAAVGAALFAVALIYVLWSMMKGLRHVERYFKGARGEEKVAGILARLPDAYHVFNDFVVGRNHIDHVVVGPAGVFAVETKFWLGKVTIEDEHILVDGQLPSRSPLTQVQHEAKLVKEALAALGWKGEVIPVLTFASDSFDAHRANLEGAIIINSCELAQSFATDRVNLAPAELNRLVSLMEDNS